MKKLFLNALLLGVLAFSIACSKSIHSFNSALKGQWELRHAYGGMLGFDSVYAANNCNTIAFTENDFEKKQNGSIVETGSYTLSNEGSSLMINFVGTENQHGAAYKISNDSLYLNLNAPAYDGVESVYVKISE